MQKYISIKRNNEQGEIKSDDKLWKEKNEGYKNMIRNGEKVRKENDEKVIRNSTTHKSD